MIQLPSEIILNELIQYIPPHYIKCLAATNKDNYKLLHPIIKNRQDEAKKFKTLKSLINHCEIGDLLETNLIIPIKVRNMQDNNANIWINSKGRKKIMQREFHESLKDMGKIRAFSYVRYYQCELCKTMIKIDDRPMHLRTHYGLDNAIAISGYENNIICYLDKMDDVNTSYEISRSINNTTTLFKHKEGKTKIYCSDERSAAWTMWG